MLVWLIKDGENLPVQHNARKMRMWMLTERLLKRGHAVLWWSSTFSHQRKALLYTHDIQLNVEPNCMLNLLHSGKYQHNVSFKRHRHHRLLAKKFSQQADHLPTPDVIVCAFPMIDLAYEAVVYAGKRNVPIIIDIRDLWPDIFIEKSPRLLRGFVRALLDPTFRRTRQLLQNADSIVAVSQGYLKWGLANSGRLQTEDDKVFYLGCNEENTGGEEATERIQKLYRSVQGKIVFTFVGSFGRSYELKIICDVARRMTRMGISGIHFILAGDGEQYEAISRDARFLRNMSLTGWLDRDDLRYLLTFTNVGLVPYISAVDRVPNKPFDYLSIGLPILSSLEGEMERIVADNDIGFSYRCGDLERLSELVVKLATDHALRKRQARNARDLFMREFRAEVIYDAYTDHVERIAAKRIATKS